MVAEEETDSKVGNGHTLVVRVNKRSYKENSWEEESDEEEQDPELFEEDPD